MTRSEHQGSCFDSATMAVRVLGEYVSVETFVADGRRLAWVGTATEALDLARSITGAAVGVTANVVERSVRRSEPISA
jgi:hypothetical protein